MKGVHRKGHQRASCLLCRSFPLSLIMSSLQSYYCTSWLHLSFTLSLGLSTLFSLVGGLLREPQPRRLLPYYLFVGSYASPFRGSHYALWKRIDTFSRDLLAFNPVTLHGVINKSLSSIVPGLTVKYFVFGRCHSYFSCANLAQAIFGKYLSAAWNFASLFLQIICGSLPHFLLNAELNKIRFSINFP